LTDRIKSTTLIFILTLAVVLCSVPSAARETRWERAIAPDIHYTFIKRSTLRGPVRVHKLKINTSSPNINIMPAIARDKIGSLERVDSIARREEAIAAVNGSFFHSRRPPHLPVGILIANGKVINKSLLNRTAMGITRSGNVIFGKPRIKGKIINPGTKEEFDVWGVNRPRKNSEVIIYTPEYGRTSQTNQWGREIVVSGGKVVEHCVGNSMIPGDGCVVSFHGWTRKFADSFPVGSDIELNFGLTGSWKNVDHVITGGPLLLKDGKRMVKSSVIEEIFRGIILKPSARTAVGVDEYGKLLLFVVDKRRGESIGATFSELAKIMKDEGAVEGMALDGGGSSTLVIDGAVKNRPSYGRPVSVSNALVVKRKGYKFVAKAPPPTPARKPAPTPETKPAPTPEPKSAPPPAPPRSVAEAIKTAAKPLGMMDKDEVSSYFDIPQEYKLDWFKFFREIRPAVTESPATFEAEHPWSSIFGLTPEVEELMMDVDR